MSWFSPTVTKAIVFAVVSLLAIVIGVQLADPLGRTSMGLVGGLALLLLFPFLVKHHHLILALTWNSIFYVFFLPGSPPAWVVMAFVSLGTSILIRTINKQVTFTNVKELTWPLLCLACVSAATAYARGGLGFRFLGGESNGGKQTVFVLAAIVGYFALSVRPTSLKSATFLAAAFVLGATTQLTASFIQFAGGTLDFLTVFLSTELAGYQADSGFNSFARYAGLARACLAIVGFLLLRHGIRGVFLSGKPFRSVLILAAAFLSLFGGFRSGVLFLVLLSSALFLLEGLWKTKWAAIAIGFVVMGSIAVALFSRQLPVQVQRSLAFLPIDISPDARLDAEQSSQWRIDIWKAVLPEVPQYLFLGKGHGMNATDVYLTPFLVEQGIYRNYEPAILTGNYHQGLLSLIIPLGLPGFICFVWLMVAGFRVLIRNLREGDPALRTINRYLLAWFSVQLVFFCVIYGHFSSDIAAFCGILGLSVSINAKKAQVGNPVQQLVRRNPAEMVGQPAFSRIRANALPPTE